MFEKIAIESHIEGQLLEYCLPDLDLKLTFNIIS